MIAREISREAFEREWQDLVWAANKLLPGKANDRRRLLAIGRRLMAMTDEIGIDFEHWLRTHELRYTETQH